MAIPSAKKVLADSVEFAPDPYSAVENADCCIIMTEWGEFGKLKAKDFHPYMRAPSIVDARRIYDPADFSELNFVAVGLGPPSSSSTAGGR